MKRIILVLGTVFLLVVSANAQLVPGDLSLAIESVWADGQSFSRQTHTMSIDSSSDYLRLDFKFSSAIYSQLNTLGQGFLFYNGNISKISTESLLQGTVIVPIITSLNHYSVIYTEFNEDLQLASDTLFVLDTDTALQTDQVQFSVRFIAGLSNVTILPDESILQIPERFEKYEYISSSFGYVRLENLTSLTFYPGANYVSFLTPTHTAADPSLSDNSTTIQEISIEHESHPLYIPILETHYSQNSPLSLPSLAISSIFLAIQYQRRRNAL